MSSVTVEINGRETVSQAALGAQKSIGGLSSSAKQAQADTESLSKETGNLKSMFGGFVVTAGDVVNAVKSIASAVYSTVEAFAEQERSVSQFNAAMRLSKTITADGANSLRIYAQEIATLTGQSDETILSMEAFLASSGRNEDQIKRLITAAANFSAATGKDMRSAVEQLNKTFGGFAGELGESNTAIKNLTSEQLKAGAAIDAVGQQYAGFADQLSGISDITLKNFKTAYQDVIAELGKAVYPAIEPALKAVTAWMNEKLIPAIGDFFNTMVAVFENFPEVAKRTFQLIYEIIRLTFSWDGMAAILQALGDNIINAFSSAFSVLPDMFLNIIGLMFNPITQLGLYIADTLTKAFSGKGKEIKSPGDFIAGLFELQATAIGNIAKDAADLFSARFGAAVSLAGDLFDIYSPEFTRYYSDIAKIIQPTITRLEGGGQGGNVVGVGNGGSGTASSETSLASNAMSIADQAWSDRYSGLAQKFIDEKPPESLATDALSTADKAWAARYAAAGKSALNEALNMVALIGEIWAERPVLDQVDKGAVTDEALYLSVAAYLETLKGKKAGTVMQGLDESLYETWFPSERNLDWKDAFESAGIIGNRDEETGKVQGGTEIGNMLAGLSSMGETVWNAVKGIVGMVSSLSSFQAIMNPLQTIFSAMMDVLGPLINTILQPIVGILKIIGMTIGQMLAPILSALAPVIKLIGDAFVWLYNNAIRPFANFIISIGNFLFNAIASAYNWINNIWGGSDIKLKESDDGYLKEITSTDLNAVGATGSTGSTSGAAATYDKPRDIMINVQVTTAALVGNDGISQFALIIGRELRSAGVLGMA